MSKREITESIKAAYLPVVMKKLKTVNRRAAQLGVTGLTLDASDPYPVSYRDEHGFRRTYQALDVTVSGEDVRLAGWGLRGVVDLSHSEPMFRMVPGFDAPEIAKSDAGRCDHCNKVRTRAQTYILEHEDGRGMLVGRSCMKDFLGVASPESLYWWMGAWGRIEDMFNDEPRPSGGDIAWELTEVLNVAASMIRIFGWVSAGRARAEDGIATKQRVGEYLQGGGDTLRNLKDEAARRGALLEILDVDRKVGPLAIAWLRMQSESDFIHNCRVLANDEFCRDRDLGLACAIVGCYHAAQARESEETSRRENGAGSEYVGTVKTRKIFIDLTVISKRRIDSDFGTSTLITFADPGGNQLVWFCSGYEPDEMVEGATLDVRATVKRHSEFRGVKQTSITRATVVKTQHLPRTEEEAGA